jgi:hypothetical protein
VETAGHECLRRHIGLESQLSGCGTVRHLIQVSDDPKLPAAKDKDWHFLKITIIWQRTIQATIWYVPGPVFRPQYTDFTSVVQNPEDAASREAAFDYVLLCVKALPDVYNLADIIESVVTPQHTCILVNTTNTLGVEQQLEQRFPTNVVLSLVSGADLVQLGSSEFEQTGSTEIWVGPANLNSAIPDAIQNDMSEALAMTLSTGQVDCKVSPNIRQQQFERMIGYVQW